MKTDFDTIIADYLELPLPSSLIKRNIGIPRAPGNALAVIGMRRTGKTWLCFQMMKNLLDRGVAREQIFYINFEDERLLHFTSDDFQPLLEAFLRRATSVPNREVHLFFDEIQQVAHWPRFIRRLLDQGYANITLTGSSAKMLSTEIHTSLRGRSISCEVFPFTLEEYSRAQGFTWPEKTPSTKRRIQLERLCDEYLTSGGFPGLLGLDEHTRRQMLQQYLDVVILRDVVERHQITSVVALHSFVRQIIHSPSTRLSINKIYNDFKSRDVKCSKNGLHSFLGHLEEAYLIFTVPIHSRSERKRQVNPKKIYLIDTGLLAAASLNITRDQGAMLENLVFLSLRRQGYIIEYFHDANDIETDFVVREPLSGKITQLIQVCWSLTSEKTREREIRGLKTAMNQLGMETATIVTWREEETLAAENSAIDVVPFWKFETNQ